MNLQMCAFSYEINFMHNCSKKNVTVPVVFFMSTFGTLEEKPSHDFWP